jgi:hypothetical protein
MSDPPGARNATRIELSDLLSTRFAPIQERLLPLLGVVEIVALTKTSKKFADMNEALRTKEYSINLKLKRWFSDPVAFRSVQAQCDALIIGDFARQFFPRLTALTNSLTLSLGDPYMSIVKFLTADGYAHIESGEYRKTCADGEVRTVFVYYSCSNLHPPVHLALKTADTTAKLQVIAWNKAYSLYPYVTFIEKKSYDVRPSLDYYLRLKTDYPGEVLQNKTCRRKKAKQLARPRRIIDNQSWIIDLDVSDILPSPTPDCVLEATTFRLQYVGLSFADFVMDIVCTLRQPVLRYTYVTMNKNSEGSEYSQKVENLKHSLDGATLLQMAGMANRPDGYQELVSDPGFAAKLRDQFVLPDTWKFYDNEAITFLDEAWTASLEEEKRRSEEAEEMNVVKAEKRKEENEAEKKRTEKRKRISE